MKNEEDLQHEWDEEARRSVRRERAYAVWCVVVAGLIAVGGIAVSLLREYVIWFK